MTAPKPASTPVARSKTAALARVLDSIPKGYIGYTSGQCSAEKAVRLARKFHEQYGIGCSPAQRMTRKKKGLANAILVMYWPPEQEPSRVRTGVSGGSRPVTLDVPPHEAGDGRVVCTPVHPTESTLDVGGGANLTPHQSPTGILRCAPAGIRTGPVCSQSRVPRRISTPLLCSEDEPWRAVDALRCWIFARSESDGESTQPPSLCHC